MSGGSRNGGYGGMAEMAETDIELLVYKHTYSPCGNKNYAARYAVITGNFGHATIMDNIHVYYLAVLQLIKEF